LFLVFLGAGFLVARPAALSPDPNAPRPIEALDTVIIEEMTWMEVRDALQAGKTTVIVPTGGVEQNGPYLATGKHDYILHATTEAIARKLGDALVAPIVDVRAAAVLHDEDARLLLRPAGLAQGGRADLQQPRQAQAKDANATKLQQVATGSVRVGCGGNVAGERHGAPRSRLASGGSTADFIGRRGTMPLNLRCRPRCRVDPVDDANSLQWGEPGSLPRQEDGLACRGTRGRP